MNIQQTPLFERTVKKLTKQQKKDVDNAVITVWNNPDIGEAKVGDLAGVFVYKFKIHHQEMLLAYEWHSHERLLLALGVHENFYRDLKRQK